MKKHRYQWFIILLLVLSSAILQAAPPIKTFTLGVYSYRPKAIMVEQYQPLVDYLNIHLSHCCKIKLQILKLDELETALTNNQLDFILTNPLHYIILRHQSKLTGAIATLIKQSKNGSSTHHLGGVIFTRSSEESIKNFTDVKGHRIAIPNTKHLGGYLTQAYELHQSGINLPEDATLIEVGSHDKVVDSVLSGQAEIGFVRTEILENMSQNGKIDLTQLKVLNLQKIKDFSFMSSTRLYPEWPVVALPHVDYKVVSQIASALLAINAQQFAIHNVGIAGFSPPADYLPVEKIARKLRLSPYENAPDFTLYDIWSKHKKNFIVLVIFLFIISILSLVLFRRNQLIDKQQKLVKNQSRHIQQIIDATQVGTWEWKIQTGEIIVNERWAELIGYTLAELSPTNIHTWEKFTHSDDLKLTEQSLQLHFDGKTDFYKADFRMRHKHSHWVWLNARGQVIQWAEDGKPLWMSGTNTNISERKEFEQQISRAHRLVEQSLNEIYIFDKSTHLFIEVNQAAQKNLGYTMEELSKLTPFDIKPKISTEEFTRMIEPLLCGTQQELVFNAEHQRKDGSHYPVEIHLQLLEDEHPVFIAIIHDITDRIQKEMKLQESQRKYQRLVEDVGEKFVIFSHKALTGELTYISNVTEHMFGISSKDAIGKSWAEIINWLPGEIEHGQAFVARQIEGKLDFTQMELSFIHPDGSQRTIQSSTHPIRDESGQCISIDGIAEDITERKLAQKQIQLTASVFANSQEGILITDKDNRIVDVNPACLEVTGYTREEVIGQTPGLFSSNIQSPEFYAQMWQSLMQSGRWQGEIWNRKKSGEIYSERLSIDRVLDDNGQLQNYVAIFYDITYLKKQEEKLIHIAHHDPLTGLPNRLLLRDRLQQAVFKAERNEKLLAVCYLDLDGFKPINDTYGHKAGDYVLVEVAKRLQNSIRAGDTVARIGGDEFVILMLDLDTIEELKQVLKRILVTISSPYTIHENNIINEADSITASIGLTLYPHDKSEADMLLRHADQAMYIAKQDGKNRYYFFDKLH